MVIYLDKKHRKDREAAVKVARNILYTTLENIAEAIYQDPVRGEIVVELSEAMMEDRGVTMEDLKEKVKLANCAVKISGKRIYIKPKKPETLRRLLEKVSSIHIKGIPGIKRVLITEERGEWVIRTDGSNLPKVLEVYGVDATRTITNNIHEIARTLGIEAARNALINEAKNVLDEQGLDVDIRHVMLVADMMTFTGEVQQIGRHGVSGKKASVLARAAFEITVPNIIEAAVRGEADPLEGVTENVIVGQTIPVGTGLVELYMSTYKPEGEGK
jgi:DNA-directed RNA polymerase subunit A"